MVVFPQAEARLFKNTYVCKRCESKIKVPIGKVLAGKGVCRKCSSKSLRIVRKRSKN